MIRTCLINTVEEVFRPPQTSVDGILVSPKDQQEMQTAIEWLLNHEGLWATLGGNARKSVVEKYSVEVAAEKYIEMFTELERLEEDKVIRVLEGYERVE